MKTSAIITTIGVIIILVIGGLVLLRSQGENVVSPDPTPPDTQEESDDLFQQEIDFEPQVPLGEENEPAASPLPAAEGETQEAVTIRMSETGFSPPQLTVDAGTTVTFVNDGQALHWPASDLHPTHDALPGFDARQGLTTGATYSYTFTEVGTWRFHDHLNPSATGAVVVR
ncbi:MAG: cupredoxin domain-containing protein [Candidatus Andersenbacteria bacterium]